MKSVPRISFIGRDNELNRLLSAWAGVSSGNGPKLITLIGDSGLGKTRLVNEFYQRIASAQEYWPKAISSDPLDLNPQFDSHVPKGQIPWLWWAMRSHNPEGRNCVLDDGCAITRSAPLLKRHTDAAITARLGEKKFDELKTLTIEAPRHLRI